MQEKQLRVFYPEIEPFNKSMLKVSDVHEIYYEEIGKKDGEPVVFLHGGPGGGTYPVFRRFFDPEYFHVTLFDQRGCGQSKPLGALEENNTEALIEDIEKLRKHLGIEKWIVFGGSWGSTLALCYAIKYPERVKALVLRGIFLNRQKDIDWLFENDAAGKIFPDYFEPYLNFIPEEERNNLVEAYYKRLTHENYDIRLSAAKNWSNWENKISRLVYTPNAKDDDEIDRMIAGARVECFYMLKKCFFDDDNYIINNLAKILPIPTFITHGRYDIVCNAENAWSLTKAWEQQSNGKYKPELILTPNSGHSQTEPENIHELIGFMEKLKNT